ncbi:MAG: O-antigen ligase family protein [Candidatus Shapirobacteria bacterium]
MSAVIEFLYLLLFFLTPILFSSYTSELFEVPKMYLVYTLTILIIFFHFLNWLRGKTILFSKNKLTIPLLIFFSTQLISTFFSINVHTSIFGYYSRLNGGLLSLFCYICLYFVLIQYNRPQFIKKLIKIFLFSGLLVSIYAILEHFGIDKNIWVQDVQSRVFSTLGQPNWLAAYLCILLPFAVNQLLNSKKYLLIISNSSLVIILYVALLFTKSKSGIIAAIISLGIYFILKFFQKTNFKVFILPLLIFLSTSLIIANPIKDYLFPPQVSPSTDQNSTLNITSSSDIRKIVWQGSIELWQRFPLFGTGPETFAYSYYWTRPASHNLTSEWDFLYNKAHNEYLNYLATTGTLGFIAYLFLIISILVLTINYPVTFAAFISILITNSAGFSVVITSLFFFLLPALVSLKLPAKADLKPKNKLFIFPLIIIFLFLLIKNISFLLADIAYNQSLISSDRQQYSDSQNYINFAIYLNSSEANYYSHASLIAAKLDQTQNAISYSNKALSLSPTDTNLWKERAQVFSLISLKNPQYFAYAIDALEKCSRLAPTDAKVFYLLGEFYEAASQKDDAIKNYQHALNLKSNYDYAAFALGKIYFTDKNYAQAKKDFEITLKIAPTNTDAQNYLDKIGKLLIK